MITVFIAFISGILTVLSPCVLPILPIILASGIDGKESRVKGIISGLILSFSVASLFLATFVRIFGIGAHTIRLFAIGLLVFLGMSLLIPNIWQNIQVWIEKYWHFTPTQDEDDGFWGGTLTGASLGLVWTPCIGPILASVATLAAIGEFTLNTILVVFSYALGTGSMLFIIAKGGSAVTKKMIFVKKYNQEIRQVFGIVIVATALAIWSGTDRAFQAWTLTNLPESWTQISTQFEKSVTNNINR